MVIVVHSCSIFLENHKYCVFFQWFCMLCRCYWCCQGLPYRVRQEWDYNDTRWAHVLPLTFFCPLFQHSQVIWQHIFPDSLLYVHWIKLWTQLPPISFSTPFPSLRSSGWSFQEIPSLLCPPSSDVPAWAWSPKPAQASPGKPSQAQAECMAWEGLGLRLHILKAQAVGLNAAWTTVWWAWTWVYTVFTSTPTIPSNVKTITNVRIPSLNLKSCHHRNDCYSEPKTSLEIYKPNGVFTPTLTNLGIKQIFRRLILSDRKSGLVWLIALPGR